MKDLARAIFLLFTLLLTLSGVSQDHDPKYIFFFIGDGMGLAHVDAAEQFLHLTGDGDAIQTLTFTQFPETGFVSTGALNRFITGSAAAGTALATGFKTNIGRISMDAEGVVSYETIAEKAKRMGMKVGIISSVSIDHATPAVFYAHQPSRDMYFEIAVDLTSSDFDFFGGGGFREPIGTLDGMEVSIPELARQNGYTYVNTRNDFYELNKSDGKIIAVSPILDESAAMPYAIDSEKDDLSLADFTRKAIELLENENGFFIMVEGGKIDWASHANDPATVIHDVIAFDEAVAEAMEFYEEKPGETLIVVTADHETGGLTLGNKLSGYDGDLSLLKYQKGSFVSFGNLIEDFSEEQSASPDAEFGRMEDIYGGFFGLGVPDKVSLTVEETSVIEDKFKSTYLSSGLSNKETVEYGNYNPLRITLTNILSAKSGLGWTTFSHTGIKVPVWSIGPGSDNFTGNLDNTDIAKIFGELIRN
jgi:alkaline phosphatase